MKKKLFTKAFVLAICCALALGVAACGGGSENTAPADDTQVEETVDNNATGDSKNNTTNETETPTENNATAE